MSAHEAKSVTVSKIIDIAWRNLLEQNVPAETHPDLVKTFKRFFYAGAKSGCWPLSGGQHQNP